MPYLVPLTPHASSLLLLLLLLLLGFISMAETKKSIPLNPRAPAFSPAPSHPKPNFLHPTPEFAPAFFPEPTLHYPPPPMFYFHRTFDFEPPLKPNKALFHVPPFRWRNLPPRLLNHKHKVCVSSKARDLSTNPAPPAPPEEEKILNGKTSLMVRNLPNHFGRNYLLRMLDSHCRNENKGAAKKNRSSYDFLYLPMDFGHRCNLGYAFVNFTSSVAAERFRRDFHNFFWTNPGNRKTCEITVAKYQGKEELSQHFKESRFPCHTDDYLPVLLSPPSDGFRKYQITTLGYRVGLRGRASRGCRV